jgi:AcrR family transcriptional regulator
MMERGYAGASTLEIARRARVSKRELYALFENKQGILAALIGGRSARMSMPLDLPAAHDRESLSTILIQFGRLMLSELTKPEVLALMRLAIAESERSPEMAGTFFNSGREATRITLRRFLGEAQAAGLLGPGDPVRMAAQYLSLLMGDLMVGMLMRVAPPQATAPSEIERRAVQATEALFKLYPLAVAGDGMAAAKPKRSARRARPALQQPP